MRLLIDMNLSPRWVGLLTGAGIEAAHWSALGAVNAPDSEIMAYAAVHGYVVLTHDLDFGSILAATHGEEAQCRANPRSGCQPRRDGRQVIIALRQMAAELEEGALLTVDPNRTRLSVLPLRPRG